MLNIRFGKTSNKDRRVIGTTTRIVLGVAGAVFITLFVGGREALSHDPRGAGALLSVGILFFIGAVTGEDPLLHSGVRPVFPQAQRKPVAPFTWGIVGLLGGLILAGIFGNERYIWSSVAGGVLYGFCRPLEQNRLRASASLFAAGLVVTLGADVQRDITILGAVVLCVAVAFIYGMLLWPNR